MEPGGEEVMPHTRLPILEHSEIEAFDDTPQRTDSTEDSMLKLNLDQRWYLPAYVSRNAKFTQKDTENISLYDYSENKSYLIKKPFKIANEAIILTNNQLLFIGGNFSNAGTIITDKSSYVLDIDKKQFKKVGDLKLIQSASNAIVLPTKDVILIGNKKIQIFHNKSKEFEIVNDFSPSFNCKSLLLNNKRVLIYGTYEKSKNDYITRTQIYDLQTGKFTPTNNQPNSSETFTPLELSK